MREDELQAIKQGTMLFRKVYRREISEMTFQHKHFDNPTALSSPYIIENKNDTPIAMRWLMKLNFCFNGAILSGVQSSDDAVTEEARGLLFLRMRKKTLGILEREQIDFEYGCFYPGAAMEIAEKSGEKNVVNLYMARLFLNEKKHRWKRFDIPYPTFLRTFLANRRKRHLAALARKDLQVQVDSRCPFTEDDYLQMNSDASLHIERTCDYYAWKTGDRQDLSFVTARDGMKLCGFLIVKKGRETGIIVDWDVLCEDKSAVLAALLLPLCMTVQYLDIPSLNCENGEMKLFTDLGAKDMSKLWGPICICMKPITEQSHEIANPRLWKHRLIDADYFMNGDS